MKDVLKRHTHSFVWRLKYLLFAMACFFFVMGMYYEGKMIPAYAQISEGFWFIFYFLSLVLTVNDDVTKKIRLNKYIPGISALIATVVSLDIGATALIAILWFLSSLTLLSCAMSDYLTAKGWGAPAPQSDSAQQ